MMSYSCGLSKGVPISWRYLQCRHVPESSRQAAIRNATQSFPSTTQENKGSRIRGFSNLLLYYRSYRKSMSMVSSLAPCRSLLISRYEAHSSDVRKVSVRISHEPDQWQLHWS
ncbi:hypothetical protein BJX66DRAFT_312533 [Aspergillus keveii]|uniref:Uncharacterized protein n=1 Tax=Aspergillus keveii TaxID=714993 RepID=A0ABR4FTH0_9EURO